MAQRLPFLHLYYTHIVIVVWRAQTLSEDLKVFQLIPGLALRFSICSEKWLRRWLQGRRAEHFLRAAPWALRLGSLAAPHRRP